MKFTTQNVFNTFTRNEVSNFSQSDAHHNFLEKFYQETYSSRSTQLPVLELSEEDFGQTGYFEKLVKKDLGHAVGTVLRAWTGDTNARRVLILVTQVGNVVMFERYTDGDKGIIVSNAPQELNTFVPSGSASADTVGLVFGWIGSPNLAEAMDRVVTHVMKRAVGANRSVAGE